MSFAADESGPRPPPLRAVTPTVPLAAALRTPPDTAPAAFPTPRRASPRAAPRRADGDVGVAVCAGDAPTTRGEAARREGDGVACATGAADAGVAVAVGQAEDRIVESNGVWTEWVVWMVDPNGEAVRGDGGTHPVASVRAEGGDA